jgi:hypothetical protein
MVPKEDNEDIHMNRQSINHLVQTAMARAVSTLSNKESPFLENNHNMNTSMDNNMNDSSLEESTFKSTESKSSRQQKNTSNAKLTVPIENQISIDHNHQQQHTDKRTYLENPSVTPTALAHSLWSQVIRPYQDIVIDATAGNGKDSLILAKFLFPPQEQQLPLLQEEEEENNTDASSPQLICIDIQQKACENTIQLLSQYVSKDIMEQNIKVLHQSHAPMPSLSPSSVGLICYNLGYLPGMDDKATCQTQMVTTLYSLTDATLLLRQGGLLSVMTYPGNGWKEYCAVKYFFEGLALFTSKRYDWRDFVEHIPNDYELQRQHEGMYGTHPNAIMNNVDHDENDEKNENDSIRQSVKMGLERIKEQGYEKQTWRVFDHRPLGRPLSPILFTAMRIK